MRRALLPLLLILAACAPTPPPTPPGSPTPEPRWTATVRGVPLVWEIVAPGALGLLYGTVGPPVGGRAHMGERPCRVALDVEATRGEWARYAAHEAAHCLQVALRLPGRTRPDLGAYYADPAEGFAETYARAYVRTCGESLRPLGWRDARVPTCAAAPDPRAI